MKTIKSLLIIVAVFLASVTFGQNATDSFSVAGNCGMCKKKIEKAAKLPGVESAVWNKKTKKMTLVYDASKVSSEKVQTSIANVGYDTEKVKAPEAAYKKLDECCQYERK